MLKIPESRLKLNSITNRNDDEEEAKSITFEEVKESNMELLQLLQNPNKNPSFPSKLLHLLNRSSQASLQPFFDYTLFPLLLLLDSAVNSRSQKVSSEERSFLSETPEPMMEVSDAVAEGVICCLEELLKKCPIGSVNQMIVILKKLTSGALLSPVEASEEFREGVIRCFKVVLLNLHACSDMSCLCKQVGGLPTRYDVVEVSHGSSEGECLRSFLQSESASPAIGHWLSLLLKAADIEAARGHRGSAALRVEAFKTLRILVAKVGTADALAFFLPGVVSQIGKVLHVSKSMISGASGSTEALDQAIRGLSEIIDVVLNDHVNVSNLDDLDGLSDIGHKSVEHSSLVLDKLRNLSKKALVLSESSEDTESNDGRNSISAPIEKGGTNDRFKRPLRVDRTKDWISTTSANINKLLSATFPHLCLHPSKKVRKGVLAAIKTLLTQCKGTLKHSRAMFLECLCILVCDDAEDVSSVAQAFLQFLLSSNKKDQVILHDVAEIVSRLIKKLPEIVLGGDESVRVSHLQKLLVLIYFSGPQLVSDQVQSPVAAAQFLDLIALCFSHNSVFAGSMDKIVVSRGTTGFIPSIAEMKYCSNMNSMDPDLSDVRKKILVQTSDTAKYESELPRMPPWFVNVGSKKLYEVLAGILRLVGVSVFAEGSLSLIIDIPLGYLRDLVSELRSKEYSKQNWQSWYRRTDYGKLVRQASTAACILNEMIFSLSDEASVTYDRIFQKNGDYKQYKTEPDESIWKSCQRRGAKSHLVECIGNILHEYLSTEVWGLPVEITPVQSGNEDGEISLHFFHDNAMLHQVIIEGIGVLDICIGQEFSSCGFLHSCLMKLLENLICANFQVKSASDTVLHVISATHGYPTVGHLVLANSDYIVDAICRQLRHIDLNPHIPNVLAALLSHIGVADKILPLLEEPMRSVSLELEILGRHQHPELTIPFLKAVAEIAKASKHEASVLPKQAELFLKDVKNKISYVEREKQSESPKSRSTYSDNQMMSMEPRIEDDYGAVMQLEFWETIIFKLNDSKRYRRTIGSLGGSCLAAAIPLLASANQATSLIALDIIEDGILALSKIEQAHKYEKNTKEAIEPVLELLSFYNLMDTLNATEDETIENRLLPAMNKIWPLLIYCVQQNNPVAARKCARVICNAVQICGGDFFSRRFQKDGIHFWRLLSTSPFQKKSISKEPSLLLPYRKNKASTEDSFAETTNLKVQVAILNMIAELAKNKRSASALQVVLKKISGITVGIACSGVKGLQEASVQALKGLATIDADLIWLLLADVYYSSKKQEKPSPPSSDFPDLPEILPPPSSPKGYLYVLYGGQSYGSDIDFFAVEKVFNTLHT